MSLPATYAILLAAIVLEVAGTSALLASAQFTRPWPSALVVACYGGALLLISITFRTIPMGIVYAIWSGLGMVLIVAVGWVGFGQRLDQPALLGISLILAGVAVLHLFSHTLNH
jgi:small multidrug resistance pump